MSARQVDVVAWTHTTQTVDLAMLVAEVREFMGHVERIPAFWAEVEDDLYVAGDEVMDLGVCARAAAQAVHDRLSFVTGVLS